MRFAKYNKDQRKLTQFQGTSGFRIGPLAPGTTYSYQMVNYRDVNIKWLTNDGVLRERTISYDVDAKSLSTGSSKAYEFAGGSITNAGFIQFTQFNRFLAVAAR